MENQQSLTPVQSQRDIETLISAYNDFHDACIVSMQYESGAFVDETQCMHGPQASDCRLLVLFHSQSLPPKKKALELHFAGVRRANLIGLQEHYWCEILDCHLSFYENHIVWANTKSFGPSNYSEDCLLHEPMDTFIVADHLSWRFVE